MVLLCCGCNKQEEATTPTDNVILSDEECINLVKQNITSVLSIVDLYSIGLDVVDGTKEGEIYDKDQNIYHEVNSDTIKSIQDIKDQTEKVFQVDCAQRLFYDQLLEAEYPMYQEIDGKLCIAMMEVTSIMSIDQDTLTIEEISEDSFVANYKQVDPKTATVHITFCKDQDQWLVKDIVEDESE